MSKERDYSTTGQSSGTGGNIVFINPDFKTGVFKHKATGNAYRGIQGYLDEVRLHWWPEGAHDGKKIPARFEYKFGISAQDDFTEGKPIKLFSIGLSYRSQSAHKVINCLLDAINDPDWLELPYINLSLGIKDDRYMASLYVRLSPEKDLAPQFYPWDNDLKGFKGVPARIDTGVKDPNTDDIIWDTKERDAHWLYHFTDEIYPTLHKGQSIDPTEYEGRGYEILKSALDTNRAKHIMGAVTTVEKGNDVAPNNAFKLLYTNCEGYLKTPDLKIEEVTRAWRDKEVAKMIKIYTPTDQLKMVSLWEGAVKALDSEGTGWHIDSKTMEFTVGDLPF